MFVLVLQELPDLLRPPEGSGACMDFADDDMHVTSCIVIIILGIGFKVT